MTCKYSIASPVPETLAAINMIDGLDACHESNLLSDAGARRTHLDFSRSPAMVIRYLRSSLFIKTEEGQCSPLEPPDIAFLGSDALRGMGTGKHWRHPECRRSSQRCVLSLR